MNVLLLHKSVRTASEVGFSRSGGPGGQNVNKVNTKVTLRLALNRLEGLSENELARLGETLASRLVHRDDGIGELVITSSEERSQRVNLERAYARLEALIAASARLPKRRRPSKPSRAARETRLARKHIHGAKKASRRFSPETE
ncbi:MAG: aminoacyl-tRNA hydrolase [Spirochaetaceae bacterium]|jgi:ribosome-associated protein|nr:aminoacyl-tRNA hydrolase [Spirochaetaceae bacterium]